MSTLAAPTRDQVESLVRSILRKHAAAGRRPTDGNGRAAAARGPSWWSTSRRGTAI